MHLTSDNAEDKTDSLQAQASPEMWRERLLQLIMLLHNVIATPMMLLFWLVFPEKWQLNAIGTSAVILIWSLWIFHSVHYKIRAGFMLFIMYLVGTAVLCINGPISGPTLSYSVLVVLTGLFFGKWACITALFFAAGTMLGCAILVNEDLVPTKARCLIPFSTWFSSSFVFFLLTGMLCAITFYVIARIREVVEAQNKTLQELVKEKDERAVAEARQHDAEEAARQSQKMEMVGRLAGGVAHDFNNALLVILAWTDMLQTDEDMSEKEKREALGFIEKAATQSAAMTRRLLTMGRRDTRRPESVDIAQALTDSRSAISRLFPSDMIIELTLEDTPPVWVDPAQLDQCLLNLAINAKDAMDNQSSRKGGTLTLGCRHDAGEDMVEIWIRDTGSGMDENTKARIFEPFFTTKGTSGSGLGLSTVHGIITQSGGQITVDSAPGEGTTFTLWLPRAHTITQVPETATLPHADGSILIVEDDPAARAVLVKALKSAGYTVHDAPNADEALQIARRIKTTLDFLCSDVVMPGMLASSMIEKVKELHPDIKVLICSGYIDDELVRRSIHQGDFDMITKPFKPQALIEKLSQI